MRADFNTLSADSQFTAKSTQGTFPRRFAAFDRVEELVAINSDFPRLAGYSAGGTGICAYRAIAAP